MKANNCMRTGVAALATALAMNCSESDSPISPQPEYQDINLELRIDSTDANTGYVLATVTGARDCQLYAMMTEADTLIASQRAYADDSAKFEFLGLKKPMDGILTVFNRADNRYRADTAWKPVVFPEDTGVADTNGYFDSTQIEHNDTSYAHQPVDTSAVDTARADTSVIDTSLNGSDTTHQNLYKRRACLDRLFSPHDNYNARLARPSQFYKPRQYTKV